VLPRWQTAGVLPDAIEGQAYDATLSAVGAVRYELIAGGAPECDGGVSNGLPAGVLLAGDGRLHGTPGYGFRSITYVFGVAAIGGTLPLPGVVAVRWFFLTVRDQPVPPGGAATRTRVRFEQTRGVPLSEVPQDLGDRRHFALSWTPMAGTVAVWVNHAHQTSADYTLSGNVLCFVKSVSAEKRIEATYRHAGA